MNTSQNEQDFLSKLKYNVEINPLLLKEQCNEIFWNFISWIEPAYAPEKQNGFVNNFRFAEIREICCSDLLESFDRDYVVRLL